MTFSYSPQDPFPQDGFIVTDEYPSEQTYDGIKLLVLGQFSAERYQPETGEEVCISIMAKNDASFGVADAKLSGMFRDILRLRFDDLAVGSADHETAVSITEDQARQVVQFVKSHKDKKKFVIHCFAGMSRSRSTAGAIADYLDLPYDFTVMNTHVYNTIIDAFVEGDETLNPPSAQ